jgi:hypothetical protein
MGEDARAVAFHVLVEPDAGAGLGQDHFKRCLAALKRITPQVVAVQLNQVEGRQEHCGIASAVADAIEARHSVVATASPSMMQERERNLATDSTIRGKRYVRSLLGRL